MLKNMFPQILLAKQKCRPNFTRRCATKQQGLGFPTEFNTHNLPSFLPEQIPCDNYALARLNTQRAFPTKHRTGLPKSAPNFLKFPRISWAKLSLLQPNLHKRALVEFSIKGTVHHRFQ